jgi:integrase
MWAVEGKDEAGKVWRRSLRTRDRATAERRFHDYRVETPGDTVADAVEAYLKEKKVLGARSFGSMVTCWRSLRGVFGHLRPEQITRGLCRDYTEMRRRGGVQAGTVIKDLGFLRAALRWSGRGAGATFWFPPAPPPKDRYITREECQALIDAAELPHIKLFIILAWATAGRASAILELEWPQIDFIRGRIRLQKGPGTAKGRATVPMTPQAREALESAHSERTSEHVIEWGGGPVKSVKRSFAEACRKANLQGITPHVMRHSSAVAMVEAGVPIIEIAQYLGHTNPAITYKTYARFSPEYLSKAAAALA